MFSGLSDDQIALLGCAAAVFVCGGLMSLSHLLRPREEQEPAAATPATLAFPARAPQAGDRADRRAA